MYNLKPLPKYFLYTRLIEGFKPWILNISLTALDLIFGSNKMIVILSIFGRVSTNGIQQKVDFHDILS